MNNQIHKVTVGFPVYNVENYVYRSLKSVLDQTLDDIEVIVVDDCGSDCSMDVIHELITSHPNGNIVRIIRHEHNLGIAEARNTVIKNAQSKYIYFLDSDDYIAQNTLSLLYNNAEQYNTDVVYGSKRKQEGDRIWTDADDIFPDKLFLKDNDFISYVYMTPHTLVPSIVWNVLFKTTFILDNNLLFPNLRYQEDIAFNELYHPLVKRAVFLSEQTYYYIVRKDSLMNKIYRPSIGIEEANRAFRLCEEIKKTCKRWKEHDFYCGKCAVVMRNCFYDMGGLIKHRSQFTEPLPIKAVRDAMKHPDSLLAIIRFKHFRKENFFYYLIGILPPIISFNIIKYVCKKKGFF